jgi:hypothetical protein
MAGVINGPARAHRFPQAMFGSTSGFAHIAGPSFVFESRYARFDQARTSPMVTGITSLTSTVKR